MQSFYFIADCTINLTISLQNNIKKSMIFQIPAQWAWVGRALVWVGTLHHTNHLKIPVYLCPEIQN
jgi:hypothetical protein